ncbi:MAG: hypothetical protein D6718_03685 [Acidobacteria bacterium]|nr:MAG: hypothetical protein D6718_03685 [Acidobacteriota bacterium]
MGGPAAIVPASGPREDREAVRRAARGLEAVLLRQMLAAMERAQLEEGLFGRSAGAGARQTTFEILLTEALAEAEPLGLAPRVAEELLGPPQERDIVRTGSHISSRRGQVAPLPAEEIYGTDWAAAGSERAAPENER